MRTFEVKEIHITLLRNMYVRWDNIEFGAPAIDSKRPYGSSSVYNDLARFCGIEGDKNDEFTSEQYDYMSTVHAETETALQIFLNVGKMEPGKYQSDDYSNNWVKVN